MEQWTEINNSLYHIFQFSYFSEAFAFMTRVASAKNIIVARQHTNPKGETKLLSKCKLPDTWGGCVNRIVTDLCVLDVGPDGFILVECAPSVTAEEVKAKTSGRLR